MLDEGSVNPKVLVLLVNIRFRCKMSLWLQWGQREDIINTQNLSKQNTIHNFNTNRHHRAQLGNTTNNTLQKKTWNRLHREYNSFIFHPPSVFWACLPSLCPGQQNISHLPKFLQLKSFVFTICSFLIITLCISKELSWPTRKKKAWVDVWLFKIR